LLHRANVPTEQTHWQYLSIGDPITHWIGNCEAIMNVAAMRMVDKWMGVPACAVLTLFRRLGSLFRKDPVDPPKRILFVKLAEQGATVLADSALRQAQARVGRDDLFAVVFVENRFILDLLDVMPRENVLTIRTHGLTVFALDTLKAILRMRREKIDAAVDMEFFARSSAILTYLSGARRRVGFHSFNGEASWRGDLMTHRLLYNPFLHASQVFQCLVHALGVDPAELPTLDLNPQVQVEPTPFLPADREVQEVREIVRRVTGEDSPPTLILLNSNSGDLLPLRRWQRERYVELAHLLLEKYPEVFIGLTGSPSEAPEAQRLAADIDSPRCVSFGGETTLRQLLVLYGQSEIMITNDSGPVHYAALTPMDVVALFGPETPAVFGPRTSRSHAFWAGLACSPCVNAFNDRFTACRDNRCMQAIQVEQVFQKVCQVYDSRRGRS
jgi:ADP-heptose:LPS heptosyltransferase